MYRCVHPDYAPGFYEDVDTWRMVVEEEADPPEVVIDAMNNWNLVDGTPVLVRTSALADEAPVAVRKVYEKRVMQGNWLSREALVWNPKTETYDIRKVHANRSVGSRMAYTTKGRVWTLCVIGSHLCVEIDHGVKAEIWPMGRAWCAYIRRHMLTRIPHQGTLREVFVELDSVIEAAKATGDHKHIRETIYASRPYQRLMYRQAKFREQYEKALLKEAKAALRGEKINHDDFFFE